MSIRDAIRDQVADGKLVNLPPAVKGVPRTRALLVTEEIFKLVDSPSGSTDERMRFARLRADLDYFTAGGVITVCEEPYQAKSAYMARIDPVADEVWDIRSRDPKPGLRVFGSFSEQDTFVCLYWKWRKDLGGPRSKSWRDARETCKAEWRKMFYPFVPFRGSSLNEYVSGNVIPI